MLSTCEQIGRFRVFVTVSIVCEFADANVAERDVPDLLRRFDAMHLKGDHTLGVFLVDFVIQRHVTDWFAVDPRLNRLALGENANLVPLAVDHQAVTFQVSGRSEPTSVSLPKNVTRASRRLAEVDLRSVHAGADVTLCVDAGRAGANLYA